MTTLAEYLLNVARNLNEYYSGISTGGSTTTLVSGAGEVDDYFNGGTMFFLSGDLAGKTAVITDYTAAGTFTFATQTSAVISGVQYVATTARYSRQMLVQSLNASLSEYGRVIDTDASLVGVAEQEEYTLPAGVTNVRSVLVDGKLSSWWREYDGLLHFSKGHLPASGEVITVLYLKDHPRVNADGDIIVCPSPDMLVWATVYSTLMGEYLRTGSDKRMEPLLQNAQARMMTAVRKINKNVTTKLADW